MVWRKFDSATSRCNFYDFATVWMATNHVNLFPGIPSQYLDVINVLYLTFVSPYSWPRQHVPKLIKRHNDGIAIYPKRYGHISGYAVPPHPHHQVLLFNKF